MRKLTLALTCAALLGSSQLYAEDLNQESVEAYIKYREKVMEAASANMGAMAQIISGKVALSDRLAAHAQALHDLMSGIPAMFPAGTDFGETDAKAEIWADLDKFSLVAETAQGKAKALIDAVASGNNEVIGPAFKELSDACKGCHQEYKAKH